MARNRYKYAIMVWLGQSCYIYIGESFCAVDRLNNHRSRLKRGIHHCEKLQQLHDEGHNIQYTELYGFDDYTERRVIEIFSAEPEYILLNRNLNEGSENKRKKRSVEVFKDGVSLGIFPSTTAAGKVLGISSGSVWNAAAGRHRKPKGYTATFLS